MLKIMDKVAKMQVSDMTVQMVTISTIVAVTIASAETCQCSESDWRADRSFLGGDMENDRRMCSCRGRAEFFGKTAMTGPSRAAAVAGLIMVSTPDSILECC
jgi:hypothetical protein